MLRDKLRFTNVAELEKYDSGELTGIVASLGKLASIMHETLLKVRPPPYGLSVTNDFIYREFQKPFAKSIGCPEFMFPAIRLAISDQDTLTVKEGEGEGYEKSMEKAGAPLSVHFDRLNGKRENNQLCLILSVLFVAKSLHKAVPAIVEKKEDQRELIRALSRNVKDACRERIKGLKVIAFTRESLELLLDKETSAVPIKNDINAYKKDVDLALHPHGASFKEPYKIKLDLSREFKARDISDGVLYVSAVLPVLLYCRETRAAPGITVMYRARVRLEELRASVDAPDEHFVEDRMLELLILSLFMTTFNKFFVCGMKMVDDMHLYKDENLIFVMRDMMNQKFGSWLCGRGTRGRPPRRDALDVYTGDTLTKAKRGLNFFL